jgi:hypothetical protein
VAALVKEETETRFVPFPEIAPIAVLLALSRLGPEIWNVTPVSEMRSPVTAPPVTCSVRLPPA